VRRGDNEDGFVLIATLVLVAVLALLAVVVENWISGSLDRAYALGRLSDSRAAVIGVTNRIAFALVTGGFSARGLELVPPQPGAAEPNGTAEAPWPRTPFIALDDRAYRVGNAVVRLQDEAGLYPLNHPTPGSLDALLQVYGLNGREREAFAAALIDYLRKPEEAPESGIAPAAHAPAGLAMPRQVRLLTPWELSRIPGWRASNALWRGSDALPEVASVLNGSAINPNTAPLFALLAIPDMDRPTAAELIAYRADHPIANPGDFKQATGLDAGENLQLYFMSFGAVRVQVLLPDDPLMHEIVLRSTPGGEAPVTIEYALDLPQTPAARAAVSQISRLSVLPAPP
jgi:hypothetical protein